MKKLTKYQLSKISKNLDYFFNLATKQDIKNGLNWYKDANNKAIEISKKYDILKDADKVCEAFTLGIGPESIKVSTFHTNKFKSYNILNNNVTITDKSLKTFNFVNNIAYLNNDFLTVDIWHLRACFNDKISIKSASIGRIAYEQIKRLTIKKSNKLGIKGFELQAIIWLSTQNNL
jgi:hypothetical protein